jgi:hypothetical protein
MKKLATFFAISVILFSCKKETLKINPVVDKGILMINEGNFNWGNSGLSLYDPTSGALTKDIFKDANGFAMGDVAQSATVIDSSVYVVLNNSAKVVVLSASTFKQKAMLSIPGSSPRFLLPINDSIVYVTELYANKIWVMNRLTGQHIGAIPVDGETNQMEKIGNQVFVAERTKFNGTPVAQIRVVNSGTHQTSKIIPLPTQPNSICKDMAGTIWVLTDTGGGKPASLMAIDNTTLTVTKQFDFVSGKIPNRLRYNSSTHSLCYLLNNGVYTCSTTLSALPSSPILAVSASVLYAFDIDANGKYYLADAIDYTQSSKCFIYNADGSLNTSFTSGINTNQFVFLP